MVQTVLNNGDGEDGVDNNCKLIVKPFTGQVSDGGGLKSRGDANAGEGNIFEILPRFAISGGDEASGEFCKDKVLAVSGGGDVTGIAIGCELIAFEKDSEEPRQMHFSSPIDFMVWRRSILLLGLSSSEIILVDPGPYVVKTTWKPNENLEDGKYFADAFIHSTPDPTKIDFMVVSVNGSVYRILDVSLADGTLDATHDQNISLDIDIGTVKNVAGFELNVKSEIVSASSPSRNKLIALEKCGHLMVVDFSEEKDDDFSITNIECESNIFSGISMNLMKSVLVPSKVVSFEGNLFVLLSNGALDIISPFGLATLDGLKLPSPKMIIHDFKLILDNNNGIVKLWVLYGNPASSDENYVGIFSGPCFDPEFVFQLPAIDRAVGSSCFKFPNNVSHFEEPSAIVEVGPSSVKVFHVIETSTDATLQKLLSRGKYLEAHELAVSYNKDLDIVRKAEVRDKLNKITSYLRDGRDSDADSTYKQLLDILRKISDAEFICHFCVQAKIYKLDWTKEILALGKERVPECYSSEAAKLLLLTLKKFFTFELVFPSGTISDWTIFEDIENTMLLQSMKFLQSGDFGKCEKVWRRHSDEFIEEITIVEFLPYFDILFDHQLRTPSSMSLLRTILPFSVEKVAVSGSVPSPSNECNESKRESKPHNLDVPELNVLINMIIAKVSALEGKVEWPANGLKFIQTLSLIITDEIKRLDSARSQQSTFVMQQKVIVQAIKVQLEFIQTILEELNELKKYHSIQIPFCEYRENKLPEVISRLLYQLMIKEDVERFVSKYLRPYAERKRLNIDMLFYEHIKSVLQNIHLYFQAVNIPHEDRIICLVHLISSIQTKLECVLLIAEEWPVPWTPGIDHMIKQLLDTCPRSTLTRTCVELYDKIGIMRKQVPFRCVVDKHKLNGGKLLKLPCYVTMALLRILHLKRPGYIDDCKEILKHLDGTLKDDYVEYCEFAIRLDNAELNAESVLEGIHAPNSLKKAMIHRVEEELEKMESDDILYSSDEERKRCIEMYKYLAAGSNDQRKMMIARLKEFMPSIPLNIIYDEEFPFAVLTRLLEAFEAGSMNCPEQLIKDCKTLCLITQTYLPDMLLAVGNFFTQEGLSGNPEAMVWSVVEHIVQSPVGLNMNNSSSNADLLQAAAYNLSSTLILQCPNLSLNQMETLHNFLCLIVKTFDTLTEHITQLLSFYRIFLNLKEQEIPLEFEFLEIYKYLAGDARSWESVKGKIRYIGETLIKFGETDMYETIFKTIRRCLLIYIQSMQDANSANYFKKILAEVQTLKEELLALTPKTAVDESDSKFLLLVTDLNHAGIKVNLYALKLRNKTKLLERLLKLQNCILAADVAIAFKFYDDHAIWSRILKGCVSSSNLDELRRILETIRTVAQMWYLPEFAEAWKKVSEVDSSFLELCPIPLV